MGKLSPETKFKVWERDNYICQYCQKDGLASFDNWMLLEVDHMKPQDKGGTDEEKNLVTCCRVCNMLKGSADCNSIQEAKERIAERKAEEQIKYLAIKAKLKR